MSRDNESGDQILTLGFFMKGTAAKPVQETWRPSPFPLRFYSPAPASIFRKGACSASYRRCLLSVPEASGEV